jgi:beta-glucanase (GH16 family)
VFGFAACGSSASNSGSTPPTVTTETLVWSDEFNATAAQSAPSTSNWTYDTGAGGWGNGELETYCAYGSSTAPCDPALPNAYVGSDGYLHIVERSLGGAVYTSARMKTEGLQSFQYGRIEARIKIPQGQGMWPAFWMLGDDISTVNWPACGEIDIMENIGRQPSTIYGSIHGTGFTGGAIGNAYSLASNAAFAADFHTYGILWSPKKVQFYVDSPTNIYATDTPANLPTGGVWPFDSGRFFLILNVAIGGSWPGPPDATTTFPQEMLVDYVRVYAEPGDPTSSAAKK